MNSSITRSLFSLQTVANHRLAATILLAFVLLALLYSQVTPPFEAGDESRHYAVVKYMADTGRLPVQQPGEAQIHWSHEGNQPPLYYALAAALTAPIDTGTWDDVYWYNPHTTIGNPLRPDNKNITIHLPGQNWPQGWPSWRGHVLAVHLIRFLSIAMAAVTVATSYAIALRLFKGRRWPAAGAMAITAFNPMFIFISASINNDNAVIMFVTLALYQLIKPNDQVQAPLKYAALLGLLIGLGGLSKLYALGLLPLAGLRLLWLANRSEQTTKAALLAPPLWRDAVRWNAILLLTFLGVAGWFYLRNAMLYQGDIFALQAMRETAGQRREAPSLATLRAEFEGFRIAYWALFGGVNILVDRWIYALLDAVSLAALLGLLAFGIRFIGNVTRAASQQREIKKEGKTPPTPPGLRRYLQKNWLKSNHPPNLPVAPLPLLLLAGWCAIMISGFIVWNLTQPAGQGRLLYPAIAAISALAMLGLSWWLPATARKVLGGGLALALFLLALLAPVVYIVPAYAKPPLLTEAELPGDLQPVDFIYDETIRLIGYQLHAKTVRPAETLPITLYWQLLRPAELNYSVFVHLLGRQRQVIGQIDSYPGGGAWPTTLLRPGNIVSGYYEVPVAPSAELNHVPTRLQIAAGVYDFSEPGRPGRPAVTATGLPVDPIIAQTKLVPWQWPAPPPSDRAPVNFFDKATLLAVELAADQQAVILYWQADSQFETDYTVFLHVWDVESGEPDFVAGFDGPPVQGDYPTTLWAPGEIIVDRHPLDLSQLEPGTYSLLGGLYNPVSGERLPAFGPEGPLSNYAVSLGQLKISPQPEDAPR